MLRPAFALLRRHAPLLKVGKRVIVSRHGDVLEVLGRDADFTIAEVNGPSIDRINGPFILNMDRGENYDRDHAALRAASPHADLPRIRELARETAGDDWVRRNIAGVVVGAVDTISRFSILAVDELLRRPEELEGAQNAARAHDADRVRQYAWEAVRFNPHTPLMSRFCARETVVAAGTPRERRIPAGSSVLLGTYSAMFDEAGFPDPGEFRADRDPRAYLHFGWGMHQCFGLAVNHLVIPEIVSALLRLPHLRRAPGHDGRVQLDGPFPNRLVLEFG